MEQSLLFPPRQLRDRSPYLQYGILRQGCRAQRQKSHRQKGTCGKEGPQPRDKSPIEKKDSQQDCTSSSGSFSPAALRVSDQFDAV